MMNLSFLIVIVPVLTAGAGAGLDLGAEYDKLTWFLHITDLHISSRAGDQDRLADLATFVTEGLALIQPEFVMCGGDLTEARRGNALVTGQVLWEWEAYRNVTDSRQTGPLKHSEMRSEVLLRPALLCHKDTAQSTQ